MQHIADPLRVFVTIPPDEGILQLAPGNDGPAVGADIFGIPTLRSLLQDETKSGMSKTSP